MFSPFNTKSLKVDLSKYKIEELVEDLENKN